MADRRDRDARGPRDDGRRGGGRGGPTGRGPGGRGPGRGTPGGRPGGGPPERGGRRGFGFRGGDRPDRDFDRDRARGPGDGGNARPRDREDRPLPGGGRPWEQGRGRPADRGFDRPRRFEGPPDRGYDRPRRFERGQGQGGPDRGGDRAPDRSFDRRPDRGFDRGADRRPDRGFDRGFDRGPDRRPDRGFDRGRPPSPGGPAGRRPGTPFRPYPRQDQPRAWEQRPSPPSGPGAGTDLAALVGPDEELIAGRRPVEEAFVARREAHRLIVVPHRRQALERLVLHATNLRIPVVEVEGGTLTALAGFDGHQGIAAVVAPRTWATLDDVLARAIERKEPPFILALDSLEDPQNVGTLLRTAEAAGVHGVIFPTHRQAPLTPAAVKASAGAVEHLLLAPVDDLAAALADLHIRGVRIVGAEADAPLTARQSDLRGPLAIVVGSEGQGLGPAVRRRADQLMRIPMHGQIESLNAAVAGSVLLFEAVAQRDPEGRNETPRTPGSQRALPEPPRSPAAKSSEPPTAPLTADEAVAELKPRRTRARRAAAPNAEPEATAEPAPSPPAEGDDLLPGASAEAPGAAVPAPPTKRASRAKPGSGEKPAATPKPRKRAATKAPEAAAPEPPASTKPARRRTPRA